VCSAHYAILDHEPPTERYGGAWIINGRRLIPLFYVVGFDEVVDMHGKVNFSVGTVSFMCHDGDHPVCCGDGRLI
jgi:hypothetical protein